MKLDNHSGKKSRGDEKSKTDRRGEDKTKPQIKINK